MRKWRFRKDLMPNAGGGVHHGAAGKAKVHYLSLEDKFAGVYPSQKVRFGAITQVMCGAFVCLFGLGLYTFGIKGWKTEYYVMVAMASGTAFIITGIWGAETSKHTRRWKIIVNVAMCFVCVIIGFILVIATCTSIPVEFRALDEGLIRELTHMQARIVLFIFAFIGDLACLVTSVSQIRIGFRAILGCCKENEEGAEEEEQEGSEANAASGML